MPRQQPNGLPTLGLVLLAGGLTAIFGFLGRQNRVNTRVPEFIALSFLAGVLYLIGVYCVHEFSLGPLALAVILGGAVLFRLLLLPTTPFLSDDIYRYQWEGRVQRAGFNPYTVYPAMPGLARFEDPEHPLEAARTNPTPYPPLVESVFSWIHTVPGYKRLFTTLDLTSVGVLLLLLASRKQPLHRVLAYAWNPTVIVAFALCGHHDSLAILTLLLAEALIIADYALPSIAVLGLSALSKYFPVLLLPVFLKKTGRLGSRAGARRLAYAAAILGGLTLMVYLPYLNSSLNAGAHLFNPLALFRGLRDYATSWESNDSLFRLLRLAGNSKGQAKLLAVTIVGGLVIYALREQMEVLKASLFLLSGLLLVSPNAFPWYFTWFVPFLCFYPRAPLLLMSVTAVLGYSPVVAYAAGQAYRDSSFILALEYGPVILWLTYELGRSFTSRKGSSP